MKEIRYLVIGAGISGLTFAKYLDDPSECIILEKNCKIGGYCQTNTSQGFIWDYAGHFFHFKTKEFRDLFLKYISENERVYNIKNTKIYLKGKHIDYPFQTHIQQLDKDDLIDCIYGLFNHEQLEQKDFLSMLYANYGQGIVELFLKPYNEKLYACDLNLLDLDAMGRFFPAADKSTIVRSLKEPVNQSYNNDFWYPKKGAQHFLNLIYEDLLQKKGEVHLNEEVLHIDEKNHLLYSDKEVYKFEYLINTMPLNNFIGMLTAPLMKDEDFSYNQVLVFNIGFQKDIKDNSPYKNVHWVYIPNKEFNFYRVGFYNNILHENRMSLYVELGFAKGEEIDVEKEFKQVIEGLKKMEIIVDNEISVYETLVMAPAYVHICKDSQMKIDEQIKLWTTLNIFSIGRYGKWTYCSMEDCMLESKSLAKKISTGV